MSAAPFAPHEPFPKAIPQAEVHLWCVTDRDLDDEVFVRQFEMHLSDPERCRSGRFYRARDRRNFIVGRGLMRRVLGACLNAEPNSIPIVQNRYGRPELPFSLSPPIHFNVSHSDGIVAAAFTCGSEVGVDAERVRPDFPCLEIARSQFRPSSYSTLASLPVMHRAERFFEYWVLLEAYAKGRGMGFSLPLAAAEFAFNPLGQSILFTPPTNAAGEHWRFWLFAPTFDLRLAVATTRFCHPVVQRLRPQCVEAVSWSILGSSRHPDRPSCVFDSAARMKAG